MAVTLVRVFNLTPTNVPVTPVIVAPGFTGPTGTAGGPTGVTGPTGSAGGPTGATGPTGFSGLVQNALTDVYVTVMADANKQLLHPGADTTPRTFTIDAAANVPYPVGTFIWFVNQHGAGVLTIAITTDIMRLAGSGSTGNRTLAADGIAQAQKIALNEWIISGTGLT